MDETELQRLQREALADPDAFWAREVADLPWFSPWETVLEWTPPTFSWFNGATTNITVACLDRHVAGGFGERPALIWLREDGAERRLTYAELLTEVERVAAALSALGIGHGDRVTLSMPVSVEAIALMLAWDRTGAAIAISALVVVQLMMMARFLKAPRKHALFLSAAGVPFYVSGMMVSAFAVRGLV